MSGSIAHATQQQQQQQHQHQHQHQQQHQQQQQPQHQPQHQHQQQRQQQHQQQQQHQPGPSMRNGTARHRHSGDHLRNGHAVPVPAGPPHRTGNGQPRAMPPAFDGPRSPPGGKNTSHVPCKFFRQGACQAGKACPFSHAVDATSVQTPCKYFAKGNCKFGAKCALAHVLPDGRRVNRHNMPMGGGHLNLGGRVNPESYHNQGSALANSLLQANLATGPFGQQYAYAAQDPLQKQRSQTFDPIPTIDTSFPVSNPGSKYGSPRDDVRPPMSPAAKGLSVLDAPLPASFDSNGVSWIARNGPVAASVPSKFGLDSPSLSYRDTAALKNLHESAFGQEGRKPGNAASSPPGVSADHGQHGQRTMHSQRVSRPKMMSASLPRAGAVDDWDGNFAFEEDFLPNSLQELLTPQEKMRRLSRSGLDEDSPRPSRSGVGSPGEPSSKMGSPIASSPSRFSALFARQRKDEDGGSTSSFGHVGSPLRNSSVNAHAAGSPGVRGATRPTSGDMSHYFASPPQRGGASSHHMSMISQQLARTRLSRNDSGGSPIEASLHPGSARHSAGPALNGGRSVSSPVGNGSPARIDEEQAEVFAMEEEDDAAKRYSGSGFPYGGGAAAGGGAARSPLGMGSGRSAPAGAGAEAGGGEGGGKDERAYLEALYGR
ncbi:MAG: hypothetical protein M1832_003527 [Thelocarpon impressellum]|nr:MAG: hypothetical protein M1832_003527 [Thelocarpon impressellum]